LLPIWWRKEVNDRPKWKCWEPFGLHCQLPAQRTRKFSTAATTHQNIYKSLSPLQFLDVIWDSQDDFKAQTESQWLCSPTLDAILGHPIKQKFDAIVVRRHRDSDWYDMM
jgi:hypothetical protein